MHAPLSPRPELSHLRHCGSILLLLLLLSASIAMADVPTPLQECELHNLAVCKFASGVETMQPGPCPEGSQTVRPAEHEDCDALERSRRSVANPTTATPAQITAPLDAAPMRRDLAWVGGVERWLIPTLIYAAIGAAALLAFALWRRRAAASSSVGHGMAVVISAGFAAVAGWRAAAMAFSRVFGGYNNHDSAAPVLLASPAWLGTFAVVSLGVFSLLMACWAMWQRSLRR